MAAGQGTSAYSKRDLMNLWTRAGGDPAKAGLAASVALAESSGRVTAKNVNTNGTVDRGLWQINSIHGDKSTFDPLANARAAVAISDNGASFHPWVTYNTGAYKKYTGSAGGTPAPQMMRGSAATSMTRTVPGEVTAGGVGVADLLQQLQPQHAMPAMSAPAPPQFSATSRYLKMGTVPASAGVVGASSKPSVADLLAAVQTTPLPVDKKVTTKIPGTTGGAASVGATGRHPTARGGKIIGTPYSGTHTLGNWQSDNAVDIAVPVGTPMVALQNGVVVKVRHHPQGAGRFAGDQITIRGANGNEYFYAHGVAQVKAGERVRKGQSLGTTGSANGVAHLHFGQMNGDPRQHV